MALMSGASIRIRLTAWYSGVLFLMLVIYAAVTFAAVRHEFFEQLDDQLHDDFEAAEGFLSAANGRVAWDPARHHDADEDGERATEVWSQAGEQVYRSDGSSRLPSAMPAAASSPKYESIVAGGARWRTLTATTAVAGAGTAVVRVSRSQERLGAQVNEILGVLALGLPLVVALAAIGGYVLARRALAPIDHLATAARRITADRLHERLSAANPDDEIGRLTAVINETFARLESSFDRLRRFTADASHELRTPLSVVRGIGEMQLKEPHTATQYRDAIGGMLEEVDRLTRLVDTLLRLSHGDAGTVRLAPEPIDLGDLARDAAASLAVLAEERGQQLRVEAADGAIVDADRLVLREAVTNVLDNAIKYSPNGATIRIRAGCDGGRASIEVVDRGPGVPVQHRERIFDRFFRIDQARSRDSGGTGLGLAIAKWAVEVNGGTIVVEDAEGGGAVFRIVLPIAAHRAARLVT